MLSIIGLVQAIHILTAYYCYVPSHSFRTVSVMGLRTAENKQTWTAMTQHIAPVSASHRYEILDVLRGLAIFGILMVNMPLMYAPITQMLLGAQADAPLHQVLAESVIKFIFEGKFYVLFSLLFGYGFYLFMDRREDVQGGLAALYRRRLALLLLVGALHVLLLWAGDILVFYALFGFLLLLFRKAKDRTIKWWVAALLFVPIALTLLMTTLIWLAGLVPEGQSIMNDAIAGNMAELRAQVAVAVETYRHGSFGDIVRVRIDEYITLLPAVIFFYPFVLALFLLGMLAARHGIIHNYADRYAFYRRAFWWGLSVGAPFSALYAVAFRYVNPSMPDLWSLLTTVSHIGGGIAFGLMYVSMVALLFIAGRGEWLRRIFAPVGRMALSNYIMHSLLAAVLFQSWGFALYGRIEVWQGMLLTCVIIFFQALVSAWWLRRFHFGPLEWLWRSGAYGRAQPFRRDAVA
jgi:uncharacterized protein